MNRICSRLAALALAGCCLAAGPVVTAAAPGAEGEPAGKRPNIVLILIDTLRADALSFYSPDGAPVPYLSGLAEKGAVFEKVWSTASYTAPATASLFTSLHPEDHGVVIGHLATKRIQSSLDPTVSLNRIPGGALTLGEVMKRAGYVTWGISDNYNVSEEMGFAQGFYRFTSNPQWYWGAEEMGLRLREMRKEILRNEPYFLYIHYIDPHKPYHKRARWYRGNTKVVNAAGELLTPSELRYLQDRAKYLSDVGYLDDHMRRLHRLFGWDRDTLIIVTSDHGEEFGEHGGGSHGKTLYEEVVRIPLIVHDTTGRFPARRIATPASIIDILPTLAEIVGQPVDERMQGRSLLPLLEAAGGAPADAGSRDLFGHLERHWFTTPEGEAEGDRKDHEWYRSTFLLRGRWKMIQDTRGVVQLFDLEADPRERQDLSESNKKVGAEMSKALRKFVSREKLYEPVRFQRSLTPEEIERLKTLGYVD